MTSGPVVLLVDPFQDEREMYADYMRTCGYTVEICREAGRAVELAEHLAASAIVTRIRQPGRPDGIELTRSVRANRATSHLPVVIITTHIDPRVRADAVEAGCNSFLMLPCLPEELVEELRRLLPAGTGARTTQP
jgi:CheY-like chemotaxis protein